MSEHIKGAIYPPQGKDAKDLSHEELALLIATVGYKSYKWTSNEKTIEQQIKKIASNYVKMFRKGWSQRNHINNVCNIAHDFYQRGVHESLVIEWIKRIGAVNIHQEPNYLSPEVQSWIAASPLDEQSQSIFIPISNEEGIDYDFIFDSQLEEKSVSFVTTAFNPQ